MLLAKGQKIKLEIIYECEKVGIKESCCYTDVAKNMGFLPTNHHMTHKHFRKNVQA
jgi:hypothetical protein